MKICVLKGHFHRGDFFAKDIAVQDIFAQDILFQDENPGTFCTGTKIRGHFVKDIVAGTFEYVFVIRLVDASYFIKLSHKLCIRRTDG